MTTVGIFLIATNKYAKFVEPLVNSVKSNFLPNTKVQIFLFSNVNDEKFEPLGDSRVSVKHIFVEHQPWPMMTLLRYEMFLKACEFITEDITHLFYLDVDMLIASQVKEKDILLQGEDKGLIATAHPGFFNKPRELWTFETNPNSLACITKQNEIDWCVNYYFAGGFQGGTTHEYLQVVRTISKNIQTDLDNGIIAIWHDESHWNRYCATNKLKKILHPGFCYPESLELPFPKKIIALDKNHSEMRKE